MKIALAMQFMRGLRFKVTVVFKVLQNCIKTAKHPRKSLKAAS
jgi:hypothetical protein